MEQNAWEKRENLENAKKALKKFKGQMNAEVRRQERIEMVEEREFRRRELPGRFTAEHDTWKRKEDLGNAREALEEFEGRINAEVRRQEKLERTEENDFRRGELLGNFIAKMLYR